MIIKNLISFRLIISFFFFMLSVYFFNNGVFSLKIDFNNKSKNLNFDSLNKNTKSKNINDEDLDNKYKDNLNKNKKESKIKAVDLLEKKIIVKKNDTFSKIIEPFVNTNQKQLIIQNIKKFYNPKDLKIGQEIIFFENEKKQITKIIIPINFKTEIVLNIYDNNISVTKEQALIEKEANSIEFIISSSLYKDGVEAGVPLSILADAISLYSFDIDFQRDIQKNTKFKISYEILFNQKRNIQSYGKIDYINLEFKDRNLEYFLFKTSEGYFDYFDQDGKNVKKSLLKTPIDGAKLSSNFGMRKHPISGYNKLHKGVDFAAPNGTPVFAAGNGVIEYIGRNGGYGKYIKIRHNNNYKTAYAHLSNYNKKLSKGVRVNQRDIIGYVGSTGNSTGPHLHYEILYKNKQVNPMKIKLPSGIILKGKELEKFKRISKVIYSKFLYNLYE